MCGDQSLPLLIGGDFKEKNKAIRSNKWGDVFNSLLNTHELRELDMSGGTVYLVK